VSSLSKKDREVETNAVENIKQQKLEGDVQLFKVEIDKNGNKSDFWEKKRYL
jgi:hypothetical protein